MNALKRLRSGSFAVLLMLCSSLLYGQGRTITGTVTDTAGKPLSAVTVSVKGKKNAGATGVDGTFRLQNVNPGDVLVFTSIGVSSLERTVGADESLTIQMTPLAGNLNEVVVIGYGTSRKTDLTGSVASVSAKDFQKGQISTPEQMIAGKLPGVSIISNGGQPGSGSTIRIRGGSSLRASNDPLIVIDGVPMESGTIPGASNPLSFINPNDIETFTVLKDASAAAIYGTRAANGVILITTRKGTGGKLRINFSTNFSVSNIANKVDVLDADTFREIVNQNGTDAQKAMMGSHNTDWQDEIYRTAFATDNNISVSGGIKKLPYRLSLGYTNQSGVLLTDKMQRGSLSLALNPTFLDNHLKVDLNFKGTVQKTRFGNSAAIGSALSFDPTHPVYDDKGDGRFGGYWEWRDPNSPTGLVNLVGRNPVGLLEQRFDESEPIRSIGNLQLDYKFHFLPELRANVNMGYDVARGKGTIFVSDSAASDYAAGGAGGQNNQYRQDRTNTIFDFYLNYNKLFGGLNSRVDLTAGYSYNNFLTKVYNYASFNAQGVKYPNSDPAFPYNEPENTLVSFFGRLNYTFHDRYLLTATLRRDGSSRFAEANRWGMFPSVAFAWRIKDEKFLQDARVLSDLKLRLGWGVTGQQDGINNYDFLSFYALSSPNATYQFGNNYYQMYRPGAYNPNIKWEETTTSNIGLDFGFLDNRITGSIDAYIKKTDDLLNNIPQPAGSNFSAFFIANVGSMENKGIEFNINATPVKNNDWTWDAAFNVTYNRNRITNLTVVPNDPTYRGIQDGAISGGVGGGFSQIQQVGYSRNTFNLYQQVYDKSGKPVENVFVDVNGDGIINQDDLTKTESAVPDVFMGFSTNVSYKRFNAGFVLRASIGNYVYNNIYSNIGNLLQILGSAVLYNASSNYLETRFHGNSNNLLSDYYIQNGSFLRMDNFLVGYDAGRVINSKAALRLYLSAQNVFVITKYKGLDPEISNGVDNNLYPRPRVFTVGLNLNF
ncbi:SusC/RagA family TonB-linked outer membrane protein [Flavihumibacter petaseus]|uniref:Putative TonB-dependent receptor n=1 Tax=Flavihumibacter petaseus NBRC 106054 TaxID=1220578 RepID=A0A0E9MTW4_9BACT|nr:TonB-dependent receptor [Flavihumibacter petaseus]GAO41004.1 putative TonB-dependent receptor [Flavihumibacter petaseus NBRC 106054]